MSDDSLTRAHRLDVRTSTARGAPRPPPAPLVEATLEPVAFHHQRDELGRRHLSLARFVASGWTLQALVHVGDERVADHLHPLEESAEHRLHRQRRQRRGGRAPRASTSATFLSLPQPTTWRASIGMPYGSNLTPSVAQQQRAREHRRLARVGRLLRLEVHRRLHPPHHAVRDERRLAERLRRRADPARRRRRRRPPPQLPLHPVERADPPTSSPAAITPPPTAARTTAASAASRRPAPRRAPPRSRRARRRARAGVVVGVGRACPRAARRDEQPRRDQPAVVVPAGGEGGELGEEPLAFDAAIAGGIIGQAHRDGGGGGGASHAEQRAIQSVGRRTPCSRTCQQVADDSNATVARRHAGLGAEFLTRDEAGSFFADHGDARRGRRAAPATRTRRRRRRIAARRAAPRATHGPSIEARRQIQSPLHLAQRSLPPCSRLTPTDEPSVAWCARSPSPAGSCGGAVRSETPSSSAAADAAAAAAAGVAAAAAAAAAAAPGRRCRCCR